ncbi:MAG: hypothetical protein WAW75_10245 [Gallionella sp.]
MATTINMDDFGTELELMELEYGEEIMSAGWNPTVDVVCEQLMMAWAEEESAVAADILSLNTTDEVSTAVSELFMRKMYSYQH